MMRGPATVTMGMGALLLGSSPVQAQMFNNFAGNSAMSRLMLAPVVDQANRVVAQRQQNVLVASPNAEAISKFTVSRQRRAYNLAQFVAKSRQVDPQGAAEMEKLFEQGDFFDSLASELRPYGLRVDNLADAYAVYWVNAWQAAHSDTSDQSRQTMRLVRQQALAAITSTPQVAKASDAEKQELAEALLLQGALLSQVNQKYANDTAVGPKLRRAVRQGASGIGLDLDAMTLTENGFVPADRRGAVEGDKGTALADSGKQASQPPYGLIAAAGGAGFAAVYLIGRAAGRRG